MQNAVFTTVPSGRLFYHRVRKGETLSSIAAHYAVTAQDLKSWNTGLNPTIVVGQRLRVISDIAPAGTKSKQAKSKAVRPVHAATRKTASAKPAADPEKALPHRHL